MRFGYARITSRHEDITEQVKALEKAGCDRIIRETARSKKPVEELPAFTRLLSALHPGDVVAVANLTSVALSFRQLVDMLNAIDERRATFEALDNPWANTSGQYGRMVLDLVNAIATFQKSSLNKRTSDGRSEAKDRGVKFGRESPFTREQQQAALEMVKQGVPVPEVAKKLNVHRATVYRWRNILFALLATFLTNWGGGQFPALA